MSAIARRRKPGEATATSSVGQRPLTTFAATAFMLACAAYFLGPIWWLLVSSSKSNSELVTGNGFWFGHRFQLFHNIDVVLHYRDGIYIRWVLNSLVYAGLGAVVGTVLAAMAGYAMAKYAFPGREAFFNVILAGVLVPATALALPLFLMFSKVNLTDSIWAVLLPSMVSPFGVYLARIYATSSVPDALLEAARLDGASEVRAFFTIAIRLMSPALVTIFLFQFVSVWNNFFLPLVMLQDSRLYPVTLGLYSWSGQVNQEPLLRFYVIVGSLMSVLPLVAIFLLLQRFWRPGLAAGGVK